MIFNLISRVLQPKIITPPGKERKHAILSLSQKLLLDLGLVRPSFNGTAILLPLAVKVLQKLEKLLRRELSGIGAQEIILPLLTPLQLLKTTKRDTLQELFKLHDRHNKEFVLSPTCEESVADLISSLNISYKNLPLSIYQINKKFRDEMKPRFGLMRTREFIMKDLYCFSSNEETSREQYELVNGCYKNMFNKLELPFVCVEGCTGEIGGSLSHEFHLLSDMGEDKLVICKNCGHGENLLRISDQNQCVKCTSSALHQKSGIEVGHSFLLDTIYTEPLKATFVGTDKCNHLLFMSCHGIGLTRLIAASIEVLSTEKSIQWPKALVPFSVVIIPPKAGSKEEKSTVSTEKLYKAINEKFPDDVAIDDRTHLTIGKRLSDAKNMGYPHVVVIGKGSIESQPWLEIIDVSSETSEKVDPQEVPNVLMNKLQL